MLWSFRSATRLVWDIQIVADLTLCQALILAAATGGFGFGTATFSGWVAIKAAWRREDTARAESRRKDRLSAYAAYLASATELDSRFDFFTPTAGHLGRAVAKRWTADEVVRLGQTATEVELSEIRGPALVPSDQLASLKKTLISANGLAAMVAVVGSPVMAQVARDLALEQRRWLLALDSDDPSAASDALANAHPALRAFQEAARTEANEVSPT